MSHLKEQQNLWEKISNIWHGSLALLICCWRKCISYLQMGRAIAEAVSRWLPTAGSIPSLVKWDLWWTKWRRGRFSPSISVSPAILSTKFSILTITRGRYNRPVSGRRAEWTQFGLHPLLCKLKKNYLQMTKVINWIRWLILCLNAEDAMKNLVMHLRSDFNIERTDLRSEKW
jgi:hypothetical protein